MLRTGQSPAPSTGRSTSASTPGSHPTPGVLLPGTLASPRTGLAPAGCRALVARLRRAARLSVVLGARATGRTFAAELADPPHPRLPRQPAAAEHVARRPRPPGVAGARPGRHALCRPDTAVRRPEVAGAGDPALGPDPGVARLLPVSALLQGGAAQ